MQIAAAPSPSPTSTDPMSVASGGSTNSVSSDSSSSMTPHQPPNPHDSHQQRERPAPLDIQSFTHTNNMHHSREDTTVHSSAFPIPTSVPLMRTRGRRGSEGHQVRVCMFTLPQSCVLPLELRPYAQLYISGSGYPYFDPRQLVTTHRQLALDKTIRIATQGGGVTTHFRTKPNPLLQYQSNAAFTQTAAANNRSAPIGMSMDQAMVAAQQYQALLNAAAAANAFPQPAAMGFKSPAEYASALAAQQAASGFYTQPIAFQQSMQPLSAFPPFATNLPTPSTDMLNQPTAALDFNQIQVYQTRGRLPQHPAVAHYQRRRSGRSNSQDVSTNSGSGSGSGSSQAHSRKLTPTMANRSVSNMELQAVVGTAGMNNESSTIYEMPIITPQTLPLISNASVSNQIAALTAAAMQTTAVQMPANMSMMALHQALSPEDVTRSDPGRPSSGQINSAEVKLL